MLADDGETVTAFTPGPPFASAGSVGMPVVCADAEVRRAHTDIDWTKATALIMGPESSGLTDEETKSASQVVSIPMHGAVESLNVSVAAGILLFEAARQRANR